MADLSQTAANVKTHATSKNAVDVVQAGEAISAGMPVYKSSNNKWYKAQSDGTSLEAGSGGLQIALTGAATDGYFVTQKSGDIDVGATLTVGETYIVSQTAGGIAPVGDLATGDFSSFLGTATTAAKLSLSINVTGVEKA